MNKSGLSDTEIQRLTVRYLEGSASDEEILLLQSWLSEAESHRKLFRKLKYSWSLSSCVKPYQVERAWQKIGPRLGRRRKLNPFYLRWAGYAAAGILLLALGYFFRTTDRADVPAPGLAGNMICPGENKAVLWLGNHEKVVLGSRLSDSLPETGMQIRQKENTLIYTSREKVAGPEEFNTLVTPRGGEYSVVLADGTRVWLNAESELRYPVDFTGPERKVYLRGEAYFSVTRQTDKPFIVCSDEASITVLGTEFNVRHYGEEDMAATLVKGRIVVTARPDMPAQSLCPGQQAVFRQEGIEIREVEPIHYTAWKDGYFVYLDKPLDFILRELSRWYDFTYFYQNAALQDVVLTAKLKKFDSAERIFSILAGTGKFGFDIHGRVVTVYHKQN